MDLEALSQHIIYQGKITQLDKVKKCTIYVSSLDQLLHGIRASNNGEF